nr:integrase arm-type DNA-binding domain-containing protein [uncultured Shinella sp.]
MPLTDAALRNLKPQSKPFKRADGGGLYLLVKPNGTRSWRLDYRFYDRRKTLSIGKYPYVSLADARAARENAKTLLARGIDPGVQKQQDRINATIAQGNTFGLITEEYLAKMEAEKRAKGTITKARWLLTELAAPLSRRPIAEIKAFEILATLKRVEARRAYDTAHDLRGIIGRVFRFAVATGRAETDPTPVLRGALVKHTATNFAAITNPERIGQLMRAINGYGGWATLTAALKVQAYCFARPGETRSMHWFEIDFERRIWTIPAEKTKMRRPLIVPLARQVVEVLKKIRLVSRDDGYVFPSMISGKKHISEAAMNSALKQMGFSGAEHTPHGFRSTASSLLNQSMLFHPDAIEAQLAHLDKNSIRRIYNRTRYFDERVRMMQWWADFLDARALDGFEPPHQPKPDTSFRERRTW